MSTEVVSEEAARLGLCHRCRHAADVRSDRGSVFTRCRMSELDARFARYPRLPVAECPGFDEKPGRAAPAIDRSER